MRATRYAILTAGLFIAMQSAFWEVESWAVPPKAVTHTTASHKTPVRKPVSRSAVAAKPGVKASTGKPVAKVAVPVNPNAFIPFYNLGRQAYNAEHYSEAEKPLKKSLAMVEQMLAKKPDGLQRKNAAIICHLLGINAFKLKKYPDASLYLKRAMSFYNRPENQVGSQDSVMSESLILGQMAMYDGHYTEGETYYKLALPLIEKKLGVDDPQATQARQILTDISHIETGPDYLPGISATVTHWTHPEQPIAVYIADGSEISGWKPEDKDVVKQAYAEWQTAMEGRVQIEFIEDRQQADTVVSWMERPKKGADEDNPNQTELRNGECQTQSSNEKWIQDDIVVALNDTVGHQYSANVLHNTLLHEIGHSLGLLGGHSSNPSDVLFSSNRYDDGRIKNLTSRDINSARLLYSLVPTVTNPAGIHLVPYSKYVAMRTQAAQAFNNKNYQSAYADYKNALSIYNQEPELRFWIGLSAWHLNAFQDAIPYLMAAASVPGKYQDEALKMTGYALVQSGEADDKIGDKSLAEQKYQRAYQVLTQGMQRVPLKPENSKAIQDVLNWLNQRLASRSNSPIQWEYSAPANTTTGASVEGQSEQQK